MSKLFFPESQAKSLLFSLSIIWNGRVHYVTHIYCVLLLYYVTQGKGKSMYSKQESSLRQSLLRLQCMFILVFGALLYVTQL